MVQISGSAITWNDGSKVASEDYDVVLPSDDISSADGLTTHISGKTTFTGDGVTIEGETFEESPPISITGSNTNATVSTLMGFAGITGDTTPNLHIKAGAYVYSNNTAIPALTLNVANTKITNDGFIMGKGGNGGDASASGYTPPQSGGTAIKVEAAGCSVENTNYIGGGGGGGAGGHESSDGGAGGGGGGGAGGGNGGMGCVGYYNDGFTDANGGSGGSTGASGTNGGSAYTIDGVGQGGGAGGGGGSYAFNGKNTNGASGGGGGGRIMAGVGGAASGLGQAGGSGGDTGDDGSIHGGAGSGGGGWGASGGTSTDTSGAAVSGGSGGKAIDLNGQTLQRTGSGTTFGSVS